MGAHRFAGSQDNKTIMGELWKMAKVSPPQPPPLSLARALCLSVSTVRVSLLPIDSNQVTLGIREAWIDVVRG